jgi:hypothetical protein
MISSRNLHRRIGKHPLFAAWGLAKRRSPLRRVMLPSIALLGAGTILAAAAAFLLAPRSASELRHGLSAAAKQLRRRLDKHATGRQRRAAHQPRERELGTSARA